MDLRFKIARYETIQKVVKGASWPALSTIKYADTFYWLSNNALVRDRSTGTVFISTAEYTDGQNPPDVWNIPGFAAVTLDGLPWGADVSNISSNTGVIVYWKLSESGTAEFDVDLCSISQVTAPSFLGVNDVNIFKRMSQITNLGGGLYRGVRWPVADRP